MDDSFRPRKPTFRHGVSLPRRWRLLTFEHRSVDQSVLTKTDTSTVCGWKGTASYYTLNVDGKEAETFHTLLRIDS